MENATDALIMAGSVLLLIIALTVSISSFTNLRAQVDEIILSREQSKFVQNESGDYLNFLKSNTDDAREVGIETVISAIRRIRKENYEIYIILNSTPMPDIDKSLKTMWQGKEIIKLSLAGEKNKYVEDNNQIKNIYETLENSKFKEYIGTYKNKTKGVSDANKKTYKIVTFVE